MKKIIVLLFAGIGLVSSAFLEMGGTEAAAQDDNRSSVIGEVVIRQGGVLAAAIAAPVAEVLVVAGDRVSKGQALARLDIADRRADLDTAEAQIAVAEAQVGARQAALEAERFRLGRQESLRGSSAFNASRLEDSQAEAARLTAEIAVARAQFAEAKARSTRILVDVERAQVLAPYDAVVTEREIEAGDFVTPGRQMFTLIDTSDLEVEADVSVDALPFLEEGATIEAETRDGVAVTTRVRALIPVENPLTRTRTVRFTIESDAALAVGQSVELQLPGADGD
ncbi:probable membrane protein [Fulvimarina pelagi HTCC2506]|uniref:Probable membrane protein n=1 Tax=Fulvimarina pelagi HTCC2506 TaxID=314231 RepID=Q0FXX5_9HYPH|nr:efflux RND transporter periplasmic adaptor subunit [Fulvimarina pelagi]EAU39758.1 probable membrane protein [Fulvimarina pelagi HTCC2506]